MVCRPDLACSPCLQGAEDKKVFFVFLNGINKGARERRGQGGGGEEIKYVIENECYPQSQKYLLPGL